MKSNDIFENEITEILRGHLDSVPGRKVSYRVERAEEGTSLILKAFDTEPTEIIATYFDNCSIIYLSIGRNSTLECPVEGQEYTNKAGFDEFFLIVDSLILNGFEETLVRWNSKVIESSITIHLIDEEEPLVLSTTSVFDKFFSILGSLFVKKENVITKYHPV